MESELRDASFTYGERVLIITESGHRYFFNLKERARLHSSEGYFEADKIVGKTSGSLIVSNVGARAVVFRPLLIESLMAMPRRTQISYPKDLGFLLVSTDIVPGSVIVEGGTGSGVLALFIASHVRPSGIVYSYDVDDEYFPAIIKHAERLGLRDCIRLKRGDLASDVEERGVDAFIADVPEPWRAVNSARKSLKPGGCFAAIVPTVDQLIKTCASLRANGFLEYFAGEVILRGWRVREGMTRPHHQMRGHTVFVVVARKTQIEDLSNWSIRFPDGYR